MENFNIRLLGNNTEVAIMRIKEEGGVKEITKIHKTGVLSIFDPGVSEDPLPYEAKPTDLAILRGAEQDDNGYAPYYTDTCGESYNGVITAAKKSRHNVEERYLRTPTIRPVIDFKAVKESGIPYKEIIDVDPDEGIGRPVIAFGQYGLWVESDEEITIELDNIERQQIKFSMTDKKYNIYEIGSPLQEYVYNGQKYIKVRSIKSGGRLSDGSISEAGKDYWVRVEEVLWYLDKEKDLLVSKYELLSDIPYWTIPKETDYTKSNLCIFLTEKMAGDLFIPSEIRKKNSYTECISDNPFHLKNIKLNSIGLAKELLRSGITPYYHGDTGIGKSQRAKQIDPRAITIYLANQTPYSLTGTTVYAPPVYETVDGVKQMVSPGKMQDKKPSWLKKIEKRCEEETDSEFILLFIDEITNAMYAIQSMAFNIILDHEVAGKWKMPERAGIIVAGNEESDSIAANQLAEPLYSRMGHIYLVDDIKEWLEWAYEYNIHPSIIGYMTATGGKNLRTKYTGEAPNADPRKWELASNCLWNIGNIANLEGLVGVDVTKSFSAFCRQRSISIEDVINGNYTDDAFKMNMSEKFITALGLSLCTEEQFPVVHDFMQKVGAEACALFENSWAGNDPNRLQTIRQTQILRTGAGKDKIREYTGHQDLKDLVEHIKGGVK